MAQVHDVLLRPIITEKSALAQEQDTYVFRVGNQANKQQIRQAVEAYFGVSVKSVRTLVVPGKNKRFGRHYGRRADWKKAYVRLASGDSINFYEGEGES